MSATQTPQQSPKPLRQPPLTARNAGIWATLVLFTPIGLAWMWLSDWQLRTKRITTAVIAAAWLVPLLTVVILASSISSPTLSGSGGAQSANPSAARAPTNPQATPLANPAATDSSPSGTTSDYPSPSAVQSLRVGMTEDEVISQLGQPYLIGTHNSDGAAYELVYKDSDGVRYSVLFDKGGRLYSAFRTDEPTTGWNIGSGTYSAGVPASPGTEGQIVGSLVRMDQINSLTPGMTRGEVVGRLGLPNLEAKDSLYQGKTYHMLLYMLKGFNQKYPNWREHPYLDEGAEVGIQFVDGRLSRVVPQAAAQPMVTG